MKRQIYSIFFLVQVAFANPSGGIVQMDTNSASISGEGTNHVKVNQHMKKAVIEWEHFSISQGEKTSFIQPSSDSVILNVVCGSELSEIYGTLKANGEVILVNQNGIIVGKTGEIQAAKFLASTAPIAYDDYFEGMFELPTDDFTSMIHVEGRIEATKCEKIDGRIFLVADEVVVAGDLTAKEGKIDIRGNTVALQKGALIDVSGLEDHAGSASLIGEEWVDFSGTINAEGGLNRGNGGFVEVSTRKDFSLTGEVSTMAPNGQAGMFYIDPIDVKISSSKDMHTQGPTYQYFGNAVNINDANLVAFLNKSPVTISTENSTDQGQSGNLRIDSTVNLTGWTKANDLTLIVNGDLTVESGATIGVPGAFGVGGSLIARVGRDIAVKSSIVSNQRVVLHANRNLSIDEASIEGAGAYFGTQIDLQADSNHSGEGDFSFASAAGANRAIEARRGGDIFIGGQTVSIKGASPSAGWSGQAAIITSMPGFIEIHAARDILCLGGEGAGNGHALILGNKDVLLRAGNDIRVLAGSGYSASATITSETTKAALIAGNDIVFRGGENSGNGTRIAEIKGPTVEILAHRDVLFSAGPSSFSNAFVTSVSLAEIRAGRHVLFTLGQDGGKAQIQDTGTGCDVRAGGNIQYAADLNTVDSGRSIYFEADATMLVHRPQVGDHLARTSLALPFGTVSNGRGAYRVSTEPVGGGIDFATLDGDITIYSSAAFFDGSPADILFDERKISNAQSLTSVSGNIHIGSFRNTDINNTITTTNGAILIATDNDMNVNSPEGFVIAGGPITLIVDEQAPSFNGGGFFNNFNSGIFTTDPDQRIAIYAASGPILHKGLSFPNQIHLGNLDFLQVWDRSLKHGLLSKHSTSFKNGGRVHGEGFNRYIAGSGVFGSPALWLKEGPYLPAQTENALYALQALRTEIPERLWMQQFSILSDVRGYEKHLEILMEHQRREKTIESHYALADSREYILRATMSGETIRLFDFYEEFLQGPFWRYPTLMHDLNWMEAE